MFGIGGGEFLLILIAGLILFGPSKLPELGRALGKGLREFRKAQAALSATLEESVSESEKKSATKATPVEKIQPSAPTVDDVINTAKQSPIKNSDEKSDKPDSLSDGEKANEKIFDDNSGGVADNVGNGGSDADKNRDGNGSEK